MEEQQSTQVIEIVTAPKEKPVETPVKKPEPKKPESNPYFQVDNHPRKPNKAWLVLGVITLSLLFIHILWSNYNVSAGKMQDNSTIVTNVEPAQVYVNNTLKTDNNFTINVYTNNTLQIPKELTDAIIKVLNNSNSTI